ncbi:hypothetical protein ACYSNU_16685 [Enterococcus sp. LJL120]
MNVRKINDITSELSNQTYLLSLIRNYISCMQLQIKKNDKNDGEFYTLWSLTAENGFDNIFEILRMVELKTESLVNELLDLEATIDEKS